MNWEQVKGKAKQLKGQAKQKWGKLTDDDLAQLEGRREEFVGRVQNAYGVSKEEAERQLGEFLSACDCGTSSCDSKADVA